MIQPGDGVRPLIEGIDRANKSVEIAIFRFDRREVEEALENAVKRGVFVHALIADTNRNGEKNLRKLEMRLLSKGMTVARTSDDLVRYHGKVMIIDRKELYVLAFNFTHLDIDHSRSFGIVTRNQKFVDEAVKLFEADAKRQPYAPKNNRFIVSPINAREQLSSFLSGAKQELLIYDSKVSDRAMIRVLEGRVRSGVSVRIIGRVAGANRNLEAHKLAAMRLHTRTIVRDRKQVFIGSQSLRELELDARREVGVIVPESRIVAKIVQTFEEDWKTSAVAARPAEGVKRAEVVAVAATKAAEAIAQRIDGVAPVVEEVLQQVAGSNEAVEVNSDGLEACVREAVKSAISETVRNFVEVGECDDDGRE